MSKMHRVLLLRCGRIRWLDTILAITRGLARQVPSTPTLRPDKKFGRGGLTLCIRLVANVTMVIAHSKLCSRCSVGGEGKPVVASNEDGGPKAGDTRSGRTGEDSTGEVGTIRMTPL
jgi:hypothetical protein